MELWQLKTFSIVAKTLHFTRASEELNLSQSAVSHQIKSLEHELGIKLFFRDKREISLTPQGSRVLDYANKMLNQIEVMRREIEENKEVLSGEITIGAVTQGLGNPFPYLYERFKQKFSEIDILFQSEANLKDLIEKVKSGIIDVGLVPAHLDLDGLRAMPYGEYELLFVVGKKHYLADKKAVRVEDLKDEEWITFKTGSRIREMFDAYLDKVGINPLNIYETNDGFLIRTMTANSNRISLLPKWGIIEELESKKLVPLKVEGLEYKIQISLIWKESRRNKVMTAVLNYILQEKLAGLRLKSQK